MVNFMSSFPVSSTLQLAQLFEEDLERVDCNLASLVRGRMGDLFLEAGKADAIPAKLNVALADGAPENSRMHCSARIGRNLG